MKARSEDGCGDLTTTRPLDHVWLRDQDSNLGLTLVNSQELYQLSYHGINRIPLAMSVPSSRFAKAHHALYFLAATVKQLARTRGARERSESGVQERRWMAGELPDSNSGGLQTFTVRGECQATRRTCTCFLPVGEP